jgi:prepilin-type N-terminal cleavage/methylation domain-containing protein
MYVAPGARLPSEVTKRRARVSHGRTASAGFGSRGRTASAGFSLMELMTVVVIVGVLSALAVPTFSNYIYKSRTTEATEFLGVIRLREEAYRAEFGGYCPTLSTSPNVVTSLDTKANLVPDPSTTGRNTKVFAPTAQWQQLGARPSGPVRFGYGVVAGTPADLPTGLGFEARPDFWFVARAMGNLDGDSDYVIFETYSASKGIYIGDDKTPSAPIAKGWE